MRSKFQNEFFRNLKMTFFLNPGIFIPGIGDLYLRDFYPRGLGIFENVGIFIPEIGDFSKSGDLYTCNLSFKMTFFVILK